MLTEKFLANPFIRQTLICMGFIFWFGVWAIILGQDNNWDLRNYHFYNGYAFIHHRMQYDIAAAGIQTYLNPFFDIINYLLIGIQKSWLTIFLLGAVSGGCGFFLYLISQILFSGLQKSTRIIYTLYAVGIGMTGAGAMSSVGTTTNDNKVTLMIMASLYFTLKALDASKDKAIRYIILAALISGMATGFKLTAATFVIGFVAALFFSTMGDKRNYLLSGIFVGFSLLGFLIANGYWMLFLYQHYQSPLYPYFNNIFHSAYAPYLSFNFPTTQEKLTHWDYFTLPVRLAISVTDWSSEASIREMRTATLFLMAVIFFCRQKLTKHSKALVTLSRSPHAWSFITVFFGVSYCVWWKIFAVYRYMLPIEIITSVFIVYLAFQLFSTEKLRVYFLIFLLLAFGINTHYPDWEHVIPGNKFFSMTVPVVPANAEIVLGSSRPVAYVIPFFPDTVRFLGMPFIQLGMDARSKQKTVIKRKLYLEVMNNLKLSLQHHGSVYLIAAYEPGGNERRTLANLATYQIFPDTAHCVLFETNVKDRFRLCPLQLKT